jgi:hypothetical protein
MASVGDSSSRRLVIVSVPTIADGIDQVVAGYVACAEVCGEVIAALRAQRVDRQQRTILFDMVRARDISPAGIAIICGLARMVESTGALVSFRWPPESSRARWAVEQTGLTARFGGIARTHRGEYLPLREDTLVEDEDAIVRYLMSDWMGAGWTRMSDILKAGILSRTYEIYSNAFSHSQSRVGVYSCGRRLPNEHRLSLTVVDFGVGIPFRVRQFLHRQSLSTTDALEWAFEEGHTTWPHWPRGIGLPLLTDFVRRNRGTAIVMSQDGLAWVGSVGPASRFGSRPGFGRLPGGSPPFRGTVVTLDFNCDDLHPTFRRAAPPS